MKKLIVGGLLFLSATLVVFAVTNEKVKAQTAPPVVLSVTSALTGSAVIVGNVAVKRLSLFPILLQLGIDPSM